MKVLVVSDTHGRIGRLQTIIEKVQPVDLLIHLGDFEGNKYYIESIIDCELEIVSGNNDIDPELLDEKIINIGKYKVLITHGHRFSVNSGIDRLANYGASKGVDIVMFGHTHKPIIEYRNGITMVNPGSLTYPRQENAKPSYLITELDSYGEIHFTKIFL